MEARDDSHVGGNVRESQKNSASLIDGGKALDLISRVLDFPRGNHASLSMLFFFTLPRHTLH